MDPQMMQKLASNPQLLLILAGLGLPHLASSVKKLKETMTPAPGSAGPQRQVSPALQAMLQAGQPPAQAAPSGGAPNLAALAQLLASRGAQ